MSDAFRAGDTVKHRPSGEQWWLGAADGHYVYPNGWPPTEGKAADCELVHAATDDEHRSMVRKWIDKHRGGDRFDRRRSLNVERAVKLGLAEYVDHPCPSCSGSGKISKWVRSAHPQPSNE